jgi:hypothetical protein
MQSADFTSPAISAYFQKRASHESPCIDRALHIVFGLFIRDRVSEPGLMADNAAMFSIEVAGDLNKKKQIRVLHLDTEHSLSRKKAPQEVRAAVAQKETEKKRSCGEWRNLHLSPVQTRLSAPFRLGSGLFQQIRRMKVIFSSFHKFFTETSFNQPQASCAP